MNALWSNALIGFCVAATRVLGIIGGAYVGGRLAGEPEIENRLSWMAYITQVRTR